MDALTDGQTLGIVIVGALLAVGLVIAIITLIVRKRGLKRPARAAETVSHDAAFERTPPPPPPPSDPFETPAPAMLAAFEERAEMSGFGAVALVFMIFANVVGMLLVFGGKTFVEANVFGQLANMLDRTNGLLVLLAINQILMLGVLLGRTRTFIMKKVPG